MRSLQAVPAQAGSTQAASTQAAAAQAITANVVRFPGPKGTASCDRDQKGLLDTVYTNGAMVVAADDRATKTMAARLQVFGFVNIAEISMDGSARRLRPSEAMATASGRPWRLSRPSWDGLPGSQA